MSGSDACHCQEEDSMWFAISSELMPGSGPDSLLHSGSWNGVKVKPTVGNACEKETNLPCCKPWKFGELFITGE